MNHTVIVPAPYTQCCLSVKRCQAYEVRGYPNKAHGQSSLSATGEFEMRVKTHKTQAMKWTD